jgi:hypothetical protein
VGELAGDMRAKLQRQSDDNLADVGGATLSSTVKCGV